MKITHDWRIQPVDWQLWIDKGLAVDGIGGVTLNYQFTQSDLQEEASSSRGNLPKNRSRSGMSRCWPEMRR